MHRPQSLQPPLAMSDSGRCLTVTPPYSDRPAALLVTGDPDDPNVACISGYVQADGRLGTTPLYLMDDEWGAVVVCDEWIVPNASYQVSCDYGDPGSRVVSPPARVTTARWGDTVGYFTGDEWPPPDGTVDIIDVVAILEKFGDRPMAPPLQCVDLIGFSGGQLTCRPDQRIDILDAVMALDGFRQIPYWVSTGCAKACSP